MANQLPLPSIFLETMHAAGFATIEPKPNKWCFSISHLAIVDLTATIPRLATARRTHVKTKSQPQVQSTRTPENSISASRDISFLRSKQIPPICTGEITHIGIEANAPRIVFATPFYSRELSTTNDRYNSMISVVVIESHFRTSLSPITIVSRKTVCG